MPVPLHQRRDKALREQCYSQFIQTMRASTRYKVCAWYSVETMFRCCLLPKCVPVSVSPRQASQHPHRQRTIFDVPVPKYRSTQKPRQHCLVVLVDNSVTILVDNPVSTLVDTSVTIHLDQTWSDRHRLCAVGTPLQRPINALLLLRPTASACNNTCHLARPDVPQTARSTSEPTNTTRHPPKSHHRHGSKLKNKRARRRAIATLAETSGTEYRTTRNLCNMIFFFNGDTYRRGILQETSAKGCLPPYLQGGTAHRPFRADRRFFAGLGNQASFSPVHSKTRRFTGNGGTPHIGELGIAF